MSTIVEQSSTPSLHPGDLALFLCRPPTDVHSPSDAAGCASNAIIRTAQRRWSRSAQGDYDGFAPCVHAGCIVTAAGGLALMESTADPYTDANGNRRNGVRLVSPYLRFQRYRPGVLILPLNEKYRTRWDFAREQDWQREHGGDRYNWFGLPFALFAERLAWENPGYLFCSEAVISLYQHVGIVPQELPVLRGRRIVQGRLKPHCYSPAECAQLPQLDRDGMYIWPL